MEGKRTKPNYAGMYVTALRLNTTSRGFGLNLDRKLMLCALGKIDGTKARQWFNEMPEASRSESLTQYLLYRVALLDRDAELGRPNIYCLFPSK